MSRSRSAAHVATVLFAFSGVLLAAQRLPAAAHIDRAPEPTLGRRAAPAVAPGDLAIVNLDGQVVGQCPLKRTAVSADVSGFVSRVTVTQQFQNPSKTPIEAIYTFPLPADAAVDDMRMVIGDRTISGQIKRREEAEKIYAAARANGQTAALLDQERPNIFTQSVANIMPGQSVSITLSYSNMLKYDDGAYEFTFPMVVGPRNTSQPSYDGAPGNPPVQSDGEKISPPVTPQGTRAGHDITLAVKLDAGLPINEVKSHLHEVTVDREGANRATIRLRGGSTIPNKDFILRYTVGGAQMQTGVLAHSQGNGGYFTLILQPPADPVKQDVAPKEMVFVIDQTGSQRGEPIKKAKETMKYCLENLNPGDTFQLIGFNTQIFPCFEEPVPLTEGNMKRALDFLAPIEGNGGTDILKSVDYALKIKDDPTRLRMICYMTDGFVGNDMQVLDHIRKNRGRARMFVFGIGNSVNRFLVDGMSREGRGASQIVDLKMPGEAAASRFHARINKPILLDPQVDFGGLTVDDVYPKAIPDVFSSGPIILKGRYKGAPVGDVTVSGILRGKPWSQKVHVTFPAVQKENAALPTLWAREKLEDLQSQDWKGAQSGNPDAKIKEQVVNLALDYRLMSQYTSFVAVEDKVVNVGGKQRRIDVPVEMPEGVSYEGIFGEARLDLGFTREAKQQTRGDRGVLFSAPNLSVATARFGRQQMPSGGSGGGLGGGVPMAGSGSGAFFRGAVVGKPAAVTASPGRPEPASGPAAQGVSDKRMKSPVEKTKGALEVRRKLGADAEREYARKNDTPASRPEKLESLSKEVAKMQLEERAAVRWSMAQNPEIARKELAALKPAERLAVLRMIKLAPSLLTLPATVKKEGTKGTLLKKGLPEVRAGQALVQVWVGGLSAENVRKLKALGFLQMGELKPKQLVVGSIPVGKLDRLVELPFVHFVDVPKFIE